ncbi:Synaptonemal complex protein 2-like [Anabarilius grahami]|uniref:Synaptonemal complex protein 2-like n=1 Tax=Anabarilius grahami TaxID=495550 RepID=A0A3N0YXP3_ANAGA|nr:Synaptonemal complex protein 2-like [Anabarilius grahami]
MASEYLKEQHKPPRDAMKLIEVFYEVAMAIRTINSMLDSSPKDIRKKLCQSDDHTGLLVFSFPCIQAFLDSVELFKPEDEFLKEFWVDFNIGTSTISFFVNDPKNTLWELIHLPKDDVSMYDLQERDDQKILSVHMSTPISHGEITGKMVKIIFSSEHNIQTALKKVFAEKPLSASASKVVLEVSQCPSDTFDTERSGKSHDKKPKTITFMAALWRYQVERAKTVLFCQTPSSNGSTKSLPDTLGRTPVKKKIRVIHSEEGFLRKDTPHADYSRRKPRTKGKLRDIPLSSPSSNEEEFSKYSTPKKRLQMASEDWQSQVKPGRSLNRESSLLKEATADSGFQNKSVSETSLQAEELDNVIEEVTGVCSTSSGNYSGVAV